MLKAIRQFFDQQIALDDAALPENSRDHRLKIATAALLFEVAKADFEFDDSELSTLADVLQIKFALNRTEVEELIKLAKAESHVAVSLHDFTRLINQSFDYTQKCRVIEMMWQVAYADAVLDKYEEALIRKVADLIYVRHADFIQAKLKVKPE